MYFFLADTKLDVGTVEVETLVSELLSNFLSNKYESEVDKAREEESAGLREDSEAKEENELKL